MCEMKCWCVPVIMLVLCATPLISGELVESKTQADIRCGENSETEIISTFLFTDSQTCPQLIGRISDWHNEDFRNECASWLNLAVVPREVAQTYVSECYEFSNGTTKYRTKICCHGKPNIPSQDQLLCFSCDRDAVLYEPHLKYYHTQHCNHYNKGPVVCSVGDVCAVELHYDTTFTDGLVSKSCMQASECASQEASNKDRCQAGPESYCTYCYDTMYGNYDHPNPRPSINTCDSNPCENGGWCMQEEHFEGFVCRCRSNYGGRLCEIKFSTCYAATGLRYYTFDGIRMHYQGLCKYVMTESPAVGDLPYFRVTTKNEQRSNSPHFVTYPKYAEIDVYDYNVRLTLDIQAYVDGDLKSLPFHDPSPQGRFSISLDGFKLRFETRFGLVVEISDNSMIAVRVPGDAAGHVDGLCGNFNDDAADDYILPDGTDVSDDPDRDIIIGNHFQISDPEDPSCPFVDPNQPKSDGVTTPNMKSDSQESNNSWCRRNTPSTTTAIPDDVNKTSNGYVVVIAVALSLLLLIIVVVTTVCVCYRRGGIATRGDKHKNADHGQSLAVMSPPLSEPHDDVRSDDPASASPYERLDRVQEQPAGIYTGLEHQYENTARVSSDYEDPDAAIPNIGTTCLGN